MARTHWITGGGGVRLYVVEEGNPQGRPILFIHGFSQCYLSWIRQLDSDLARDFRLVALDLRGHGQSDKPRDAYGDSQLWADDIHGVIDALGLDGAVLSGWSYGGIVIFDYIRHYGEDRIGGSHLVGAISKLGSDDALAVISPEFLSLVPGFFSSDVEEGVSALHKLLQLCFAKTPPVEELYSALGYNLMVPPYVRQGLLSRMVDNDDLLPRMRKPVLIAHGSRDSVVLPALVEQHKAAMVHAQVQILPESGHAPSIEEPEAFNQGLREFVRSLA
jgi:non-heme chloroperoxidase